MAILLVLLLTLGVPSIVRAQGVATPAAADAARHVGEPGTVCGRLIWTGCSDDSQTVVLESPELKRQVKPSYTAKAMKAKIQGVVVLEGVVQPDGRMGDVRVLQSLDPEKGLDDKAIEAVRKWRFTPGRAGDRPVAMIVSFALTFTLR